MTLRCGVRRRRFDVVHEAVVAHAVLDDQLRLGDHLGDARARLEGVGIGVGVVQNRRDLDVFPADLAEHVGVFVFGTHGDDDARFASCWPTRSPPRGRRRRAPTRERARKSQLRRDARGADARRGSMERREVVMTSSVDLD